MDFTTLSGAAAFLPWAGLGLAVVAAAQFGMRRLQPRRLKRVVSSEAGYSAAMDALSDGVLIYGEDGRIRACNRAAGAMLGQDPQDLIGASAFGAGWTVKDESGRELTEENHPVQQVIRGGEAQVRATLNVESPEGRLRWIRGSVKGLAPDPRSGAAAAVVKLRDVTDQRKKEEALKAEKAECLGLMAAGLSHDFNNQFQALLTSLELAHLRSDPKGRHYLDQAMASLERASGLSKRLLEFSGGSFTHLERLSINALIRDLMEAQSAHWKVQVHTRLAVGLPDLMADRDQISRVLGILIENAGEAMGAGDGTVTLASEGMVQVAPEERRIGLWMLEAPAGPLVRMSVSDTGGGVDPDTLDHLFEPLFGTKALGRGLGLSAALGLLRGHQAGLQVINRPGDGMAFHIYLPVARPA